MSTPRRPTFPGPATPAISETFYEGPAGTVTVFAGAFMGDTLAAIKARGQERQVRARVNVSAVNTDNLNEADLLARRLLAAVKRARQINRSRRVAQREE